MTRELPPSSERPPAAAESAAHAAESLRRLIGEQFIHRATPADAIDGMVPNWVAEPASSAEVAGVLKVCNESGLRVVARGGGTKIDWGHPPREVDLVLSTRRLDGILEHAAGDMTATVQAGCTVAALGSVLAQRGQRLALDPLWPERATIGGIIATHDSGALRAAYGTLRDHLLGVTVILGDGTTARSGGKVVKNVAGYDLPKLFTGSLGTLGIITEATLRLYPTPLESQTVRLSVPTVGALARLMAQMTTLSQMTLAVQFEVSESDPIDVCVLVGGPPQAMEAKLHRVIETAAECGAQPVERDENPWTARQRLFCGDDACVLQVSLLPTKWPSYIDRLRRLAADGGFRWHIVAQAVGVGTVRVAGQDSVGLAAAVKSNRSDVEKAGGSLMVLRRPPAMKATIGVWGDGGDALGLMRKIKEHFDPRGTLSPGRFMGGI